MGRLERALNDTSNDTLTIHTPRNCATVELYFRGEKLAKTLGTIAQDIPQQGDIVSGILVSRDFQYCIVDTQDLDEYTGLSVSSVHQRVHLALRVSWSLVLWHLEGMYGTPCSGDSVVVYGLVTVSQTENGVCVEWEGSGVGDVVADGVVACLMQAEGSRASVGGFFV